MILQRSGSLILCLTVFLAGCAATGNAAQDDWQEGIGLWVISRPDDIKNEYDWEKYKYERVGSSRWKATREGNWVDETIEVKNAASYAIACTFGLSDNFDSRMKVNGKRRYSDVYYINIENKGIIPLHQKRMLDYKIQRIRSIQKPGPKYTANGYFDYVILESGQSFIYENRILAEKKIFGEYEWVEVTGCISLKQDTFFD